MDKKLFSLYNSLDNFLYELDELNYYDPLRDSRRATHHKELLEDVRTRALTKINSEEHDGILRITLEEEDALFDYSSTTPLFVMNSYNFENAGTYMGLRLELKNPFK